VPYDPDFGRSKAHFSNLYFGASIRALIKMAKSKGYEFVGTNSAGVNAFFVREDFYKKLNGKILRKMAYPSKIRESRSERGDLTHLGGAARLGLIDKMSVVDLETGQVNALGNLDLYSDGWACGVPVEI